MQIYIQVYGIITDRNYFFAPTYLYTHKHYNIMYLEFIIILAIILIWRSRGRLTAIAAGPVHREWNVISEYKNKKEAAELLGRVNATIIDFMRYLKQKYHIDEPDDIVMMEGEKHSAVVRLPNDLYNIVDHMLSNYNPDVFYENDTRGNDSTSYTLSKGSAMYICLRDKEYPDKLVDYNTLLFTMLHEASHIANYKGWGHSADYWAVFRFILHEAVLSGIYTPIDYGKYPVVFCGLTVNYQPLFDNEIPKLWTD